MKLAIVGLVSVVGAGLAAGAASAESGSARTEAQAYDAGVRGSIAATYEAGANAERTPYDAGAVPMANFCDAGAGATGYDEAAGAARATR
jgi:hypothetical protein